MSGAIRQAHEALARAAAARPAIHGDALTEATLALCRYRDDLRNAPARTPEVRSELKTVNALISLVHAVHYPIGVTPWPLLEEARSGLDKLEPAMT